MSLLDNIFNGPGYSVENIQNMDIFENLRKTFIKKWDLIMIEIQ